jgi:carbon starvation protein
VARFLVQEFGGRVWKRFESPQWMPGAILSTAIVVFCWGYFIWTGNISTIWPMFGTANQLLAAVALAVATTAIINAGKVRYVWVTLIPMLFVSVTTLTAGWLNIADNFLPLISNPATATQGYVNTIMTVIIMFCAVVILIEAFRRWYKVLVKGAYSIAGRVVYAKDEKFTPPEYGCC